MKDQLHTKIVQKLTGDETGDELYVDTKAKHVAADMEELFNEYMLDMVTQAREKMAPLTWLERQCKQS